MSLVVSPQPYCPRARRPKKPLYELVLHHHERLVAISLRLTAASAPCDVAPGRRSAEDSAWRWGTGMTHPAPSWSARRLEIF